MKTYTLIRKDGPTAKVRGESLELSEQGNIGIIRDAKGDVVALVNMEGVFTVFESPA